MRLGWMQQVFVMRESGVRHLHPVIAKLWHRLHSARREPVDVEGGEGPSRASSCCSSLAKLRAPHSTLSSTVRAMHSALSSTMRAVHSALSSTMRAVPSVPAPPDDILPGSVHDVPLRVRIERLEEELVALKASVAKGSK
jgi:hypothetical protein